MVIVTTARFPIITPSGAPLEYQGKASGEPHEVEIPRMSSPQVEKKVSIADPQHSTRPYVLTAEQTWTRQFLEVANHEIYWDYWWSFPEL